MEAVTNQFNDLLAGVNLANNLLSAAGGGEISMSWGGPEVANESTYDSIFFATPGIVYFAAGLPSPALMGVITAVAAVIPFAAPVVYAFAGLYLWAVGNTVGGIVIIVSGSVIVFIADHFLRPVLIGGAIRLPFLLVLLGLLGGLETFGFLGLFLGPAIMAALVALWRDWTEMPARAERVRVAPARRGVQGRATRPRKT